MGEPVAVVQRDATTLEVTELPIRKWTQDYKEFLETLIKPEDKNAPALIEVLTFLTFALLQTHNQHARGFSNVVHEPSRRHCTLLCQLLQIASLLGVCASVERLLLLLLTTLSGYRLVNCCAHLETSNSDCIINQAFSSNVCVSLVA